MAVGQQKQQTAEAKSSPRPDPESGGNFMGPASMTDLVNRDPSKHYVFVSKSKIALSEYKRMGYRPEQYREGGVGVAGDEHEVGKDIEAYDHVLMSVPAERRKLIEQKGADGASGQNMVDAIEKRLIDKRHYQDHFRGGIPHRGGQALIRVDNETRALEEEI